MPLFRDIHNFGEIQKKGSKEAITPHKLSVALLIREFCVLREQARTDQILMDEDGNCYKIEPWHKRDFCLLLLKLMQFPDLELKDLNALLSSNKYKMLKTHVKNFYTKLVEMYKQVESILDLMSSLNRLMVEPSLLLPSVTRTSVIGLYLRRLLVLFDKLSFSQVVSVYHAFKCYFERDDGEHTAALGKSLDLTIERKMNDTCLTLCSYHVDEFENQHMSGPEQTYWTRRQAELFIAQQASLIQTNEAAALDPPDLQKKIKDLLEKNVEYAEAHFLSYLNCLRVKEFTGAINSLIHCFNRQPVIADGKATNQEEKSKNFRYAALNLAMLYDQFNNKQQAILSLKEAITLAQEAGDQVCLQYALAWLCKLSDENKDYLIQRSISKSSDLNLNYLASLGIQCYAQLLSSIGGKPAHVFELLLKSDILNSQHSTIDLVTNSYSQKAALWCLYGKTEMSLITSQLLLHLKTSNPTQGINAYNGDGTCKAVCNIVNLLVEQGDYSIAQVVLNYAKAQFPYEPLSHSWMKSQLLLNFMEALHCGFWEVAEVQLPQLAALDKWESQLRMAELHLSKGNYVEAASTVYNLLDCLNKQKEETLNPTISVRALILASEIECCSTFTNSAAAGAISLLNTALAYSENHYLDYYSALVKLHLANLQFQMMLPSQALKLIDKALLTVLSHGGEYDQARALLLLVKCQVSSAAMLAEEERKTVLLSGIETLDKVKCSFSKVQAHSRVKDVLYLQTMLYNELGNVPERKKCALEFRHYDEQHPTKTFTTLLTRL